MFDVSQALSQSAWQSGPFYDRLHVWLHVDDSGSPFYVGRGRGSTAWESTGGPAWEYYVRNRLGGCYHVLIPHPSVSEDESEQLFHAYLETYGTKLLNQSNPHRGMDYAAHEKYHALRRELKPCYAAIAAAQSVDEIIAAAGRALELQYQIDSLRLDTGLFGEVLYEMGAIQSINMFFIKHLIEGLVETSRLDEAKAALSQFHIRAPQLSQEKPILRLSKIVARGSIVRRKPRAP